jgi:hypothetical protein
MQGAPRGADSTASLIGIANHVAGSDTAVDQHESLRQRDAGRPLCHHHAHSVAPATGTAACPGSPPAPHRSGRGHVPWPAGDQVEVGVADGLAGVGTVVDPQVEAGHRGVFGWIAARVACTSWSTAIASGRVNSAHEATWRRGITSVWSGVTG